MQFVLGNSTEKPFMYCKDDIVYKVNKSFVDLTGYSYKEVIGKSLPDLIALLKTNYHVYSDSTGIENNFYIYTKDNVRKKVYTYWESLVDENEKIYFMEECMQHELEIILDNISDLIIFFNNKGEHMYINKAAKDMVLESFNNSKLQNSKSIFEQLNFCDIDGSPISFENTPIQRVLRGEIIDNYVYVKINETGTSYYEVKGNPTYDNYDNIIGGIVIYRDITHRFEIEEYSILKRNSDNIAFGYASLSYPDFNIIYINDTGYNILNSSYGNIDCPASIIGKDFFKYYKLDENLRNQLISNLMDSIEEEPFLYIDNHIYFIDEESKYLKVIFQPIFGVNNQIQQIVAIGIDITEETKSKQKMAQALETQEEIFLNISHELKTPLHLVFSAAQLLDLYLKKDNLHNYKNLIYHNQNIIIQNCYRLTRLINNIMDISKIESGFYKLNLTNANIVQVVESIIESVADYIKGNQLKIIFDTDVEEKIIACDLYKIERIMLNLISNAIKFSNPDGLIFINMCDKGSFVEISVEDYGIGIDEKNLKKIFEKFLQVNKSLNRCSEGTGIGLSLVKSLVELHGGNISVESTLGQGSKFNIKLPAITVDHPNTTVISTNAPDIIERIKFEFSDIYNL